MERPTEYSERVRERLSLLIERAGLTPTALAGRMGLHHSSLARRLNHLARKTTGLRLRDVDGLLDALGESARALENPVLFPGDPELLRYCARTRPRAEIARVFVEADRALARLLAQGLVDEDAIGVLTTADGLKHAADAA